MSFLPEEDLKARVSLNLAPMIDFLFLMLVFFASLAISRVMTLDTDIDLATVQSGASIGREPGASRPNQVISLSISSDGKYNWISQNRPLPMSSADEVIRSLQQKHRHGQFPEDKSKTEVFVRIDQNARWQPIITLLSAVKRSGFPIHALYQPAPSQSP